MKKEEMTKFRVAPYRNYGRTGIYVAATIHEEVATSCFPDREVVLTRSGKGWWRYKVTPPIPQSWPNTNDVDDDDDDSSEAPCSSILDVERVGTISVLISPNNAPENNDETDED